MMMPDLQTPGEMQWKRGVRLTIMNKTRYTLIGTAGMGELSIRFALVRLSRNSPV